MSPQDHDTDLDAMLRRSGLRATAARRRIFELLGASAAPLSAARIAEELARTGPPVDLVTVYRTLDALERCSLVVRSERVADGWRYGVRNRQHHHSIVCSECGSTAPLESCGLKRFEQDLARATGFSNISHSLQFFGTCPSCRK